VWEQPNLHGVTLTRSLLAVCTGYLLGSIPSADAAGKIVGVSVRAAGTGNPGAINASVLLGKRWGTAVAAVDIAKGAAAGIVGKRVSDRAAYAAATASVVGHVFPIWSGFQGGKGVATSYGAVLGVFPAYAAPDLLVAAAAARTANHPRVANDISSVVWTAAALLWWRKSWPNLWGPAPSVALPLHAAATSALIAWRFRQPERIASGARLGTIAR
jgi:glycerol-3-phosphate acyltransferase PlsY